MTSESTADSHLEKPERKQKIKQMKSVVSSGYINFLFGAGVNGKSFPNFGNGFNQTKEWLKTRGMPGKDIEKEIGSIEGSDFEEVIDKLVTEFNEEHVNESCESYNNLKNLLVKIHAIVDRTENRQPYTKKVNIFTLNYDRIVEDILDDLGYFYNSITATKMVHESPFDVIGYNSSKRKYVPTFAISKLHGSADSNKKIGKESIILPGKDKGDKALSRDFFGVLFKMKSELEKRNAVLFIIGYSGADEDVNHILSESVASGLTVYWLQFSDKDQGVRNLGIKLDIIDAVVEEGSHEFQDTTKTLLEILCEVESQ